MGVASDELLPKTDQLIDLGADLAATFGGTTSDAVSAISALLRGERDPIERYGVSLKDVDIKAQMAADGIITAAKASKDLATAHAATEKAQKNLSAALKKGDPAQIAAAKAALEHAKGNEEAAAAVRGLDTDQMKTAEATAALKLLTEQTTDAQGQFARESDSAAHATQVSTAEMKNASAEIGTALLPLVVALATALGTVAKWAGENADLVRTLAVVIGVIAAAIVAVNIALAAYSAITTAAAAAQWLLNTALLANPIGLVVIAVLALVAAIILLWNNSETFRKIVTGAFEAVQKTIATVIDAIVGIFRNVVGTLRGIFAPVAKLLSGPVDEFVLLVKSLVGLVGAIFRLVVSTIGSIFAPVAATLTGPFNTLLDVVRTVLGTIGTLINGALSTVKAVWSTLTAALVGPFNTLQTVVSRVFGKIRDIAQSAADFISGIFRKLRGVVDSITGAINAIPHVPGGNAFVPAPAGVAGPSTYRARAGTTATAGGRQSVTLILDGQVFGRATIDALRAFDRRNGPAQVLPRWS
jgi:phage-related protein